VRRRREEGERSERRAKVARSRRRSDLASWRWAQCAAGLEGRVSASPCGSLETAEQWTHLDRTRRLFHALLHARDLGLDLLDEPLQRVLNGRSSWSGILAVAVGSWRLGR